MSRLGRRWRPGAGNALSEPFRLEQEVLAVASGRRTNLQVDLSDPRLHLARSIEAATRSTGAVGLQRIAAALQRSGLYFTIIDQLGAADTARRMRSATLMGALRVEGAVPWLAPLLLDESSLVRAAAVASLGKIGGFRSADAILEGIRRSRPTPRLLIGLARAAPDLYLESVLCEACESGEREAAALAAGLRGRKTARAPLTALLSLGGRRERRASCRALGWIGALEASDAVGQLLADPDREIRLSAAKALGRLGPRPHREALEAMLFDPDRRVRKAAHSSLRQREAA